jgi:serine/threonine protein phosphatase PrpC
MEDRHTVVTNMTTESIQSTSHNSNPGTPYSFYAVFDGHGSDKAAEFCRASLRKNIVQNERFAASPKQAIINGYNNTEKQLAEQFLPHEQLVGTTSVAALVQGNKITIANVGDSRAILVRASMNHHDPSTPTRARSGDNSLSHPPFSGSTNMVDSVRNRCSISPLRNSCHRQLRVRRGGGDTDTDIDTDTDTTISDNTSTTNTASRNTTTSICTASRNRRRKRSTARGDTISTVALSRDHKCTHSDERARVEAAGGCVIANRVGGMLAMTRALGDIALKKHNYITAEPEVTEQVLVPETDRFMILASDGLWDVLSNQEVGQLAIAEESRWLDRESRSHLRRRPQRSTCAEIAIADALVAEAKARGSSDNITVIVVGLNAEG